MARYNFKPKAMQRMAQSAAPPAGEISTLLRAWSDGDRSAFGKPTPVVEIRFFCGLNVEETASVLKISTIAVKRDWRAAKAWLYRELTGRSADGPSTMEAG